MLVFGIGCVWMILQSGYMSYMGIELNISGPTLTFGVLAAVVVTASNLLLLECLGHLPISMASTIYRLNTVPLVILAYFFLNEEISIIQFSGILAGIVTVFLLYRPAQVSQLAAGYVRSYLLLIITAGCLRALYGVFTKAGISAGGQPESMILFAAIGWCVGGLAYAYFRERRVVITRDKLKFISVAGALVFLVIWLLTAALTLGEASTVVPIANMGFVAAFILSIMVGMEHLNRRTLAAIGCACLSILLLTSS